ncbi:probable E3 ubiquitin-protein ligase RHY1A, partial [Dioscorea cayenensis subsp. rotundata]|uniref:Probable E3 ubiquitin-protein ligase RHY1A n=1 Tax=Dioscorea cayennensis subsp. rotundata TaxID=55577 RepID=A0AB40APQ5_DIOCR
TEINPSERLPGAVLEARARLVERLRNVSLSETRMVVLFRLFSLLIRQTPATGAISWDEFISTSDFNLMDSVNWEAENLTNFTVQARGTSSFDELQKKKSPGLSWDTLCSSCQEVYTDAVAADGVTQTSLECGICLEKFMLGDELIKLQCGHRFHLTCLEPWVRSSGDCPYCRASIIYQ